MRYMVTAGILVAPDEHGTRRPLRVGEICVLEPEAARPLLPKLRPIPEPKKKGEKEAAEELARNIQNARASLVVELLALPGFDFGARLIEISDTTLLDEISAAIPKGDKKRSEVLQSYVQQRRDSILHPYGKSRARRSVEPEDDLNAPATRALPNP